MRFIENNFFLTRPLEGKKAIVSAGPTYEPIDPVRFIGNHSSGKMGLAIAKELHNRGAEVTLVMGPTQLNLPANGISVINVNTAEEMFNACEKKFKKSDMAIMAAAVADFTPKETKRSKIKKGDSDLRLELVKTKDILKTLGEQKKKSQVLVGFALETDNGKFNALEKLKKKNADMIVLNSLQDEGAGFGHDTNKITIFEKKGGEFKFETRTKTEVAKDIVDTIIRLYYD
jgi:phosphopantothenoylcysteine decarboxylase/phosphopantothenate--cysteine ligase